MVVGVAFACLLVALLAYFQWLKARHERLALEAQNQTRDILGTVKDGLFLIDADFRIGKAHSAALTALFRRDDFGNMTLEELLRDTVSERTLATATKYVKLLWGERANENLIRSINPLAEVEVHFDRDDGGRDLRYLEFDFHRVKGEHGVRHILVSVNDVTSRVLLARELKESQANAQGQMDMLLGLLQVDLGNWCHSSTTRPRHWPRSTMSSRSRRAAMATSAGRWTSCSAKCTVSRARPRPWASLRSRAAHTRSRTC